MPKTPLPEYSSVVRWTVQDVVNWLVKSGFNDCTKIFREAGVDGNKLMNLTDGELRNMNCPSKRIKELLKLVNEVGPPPQPLPSFNMGFMTRQPPAPVKKDYSAPAPPVSQTYDDGAVSGSDDDIAWDDDEFDDDCEDSDSDRSYEEPVEDAPIAPPRPVARNGKISRPPIPTPIHQHQVRPGPEPGPGRRPPVLVPQYDQEETYEDPDAGLPTAPAPVPTLPTRRKPPSPPPEQFQEEAYEDPDVGPPPPVPPAVHRRKAPSPVPVENGEEYEEPDAGIQPPPARRPPQKPRMPAPPVPQEELEDYEEPDNNFPKQLERRPPVPIPQLVAESQEVYEDPDSQVTVRPTHGGPLPTPPGQKPPSVRNNKLEPPSRQKHGRLPNIPKPPVEPEPVEEQDVYEIPAEEEKPTTKLPGRRELPPTPQESQVIADYLDMNETPLGPPPPVKAQDDYLDMDDTPLGPPPPVKVPAASKNKPTASPRAERWKRPEPQPQPEPEEEECYEEPDRTPEPPSRRHQDKQKKAPSGAVPILPGLKMLTVKDEEPKKKSPGNKGKRALPPPPVAADEPTPEPVKQPVRSEPVRTVPAKIDTKTVQSRSAEEGNEGDLESYPWYHGEISRAEADKGLKEKSVDGMYCIRKSSQGRDRPYVLVVFFENKVYNLPVRRRADQKYALGAEKRGEHTFPTLLEMVNFFKKNYLVIHASDSGQTRLVKSLPKS